MPRPLKMSLQFSQVIVWKDAQDRGAQLCTVDQRRMAEFVEQDNITFRNQRRNSTERRGVSAAETKRSVGAFPFRERAFQTQMWRLRTADQPRSACANAEFVDGVDCRIA